MQNCGGKEIAVQLMIDKEGKIRDLLAEAIQRENVREVKRLIGLGANLEKVLVPIKLKYHENLEQAPGHKLTYLWLAIELGLTRIVRILAKAGANINTPRHVYHPYLRQYKFLTPLEYYINQMNQKMPKFLIRHGADLNVTDMYRNSPIIYSINHELWDVAKELITHGVNLKERTYEGYTPLGIAALRNATDIVEMMLQHGADIDDKSEKNVPIHLASRMYPCNFEILELLLKYGFDVNRLNEIGQTPLHVALHQRLSNLYYSSYEAGRRSIGFPDSPKNFNKKVELLLRYGADITIRDKNNLTPISTMALLPISHEDILYAMKGRVVNLTLEPGDIPVIVPRARKHYHYCAPIFRHINRMAFHNKPISAEDVAEIMRHNLLAPMYKEYEAEFAEMKKMIVHKKLSYADIFCMSGIELIQLLKNKVFVSDFERINEEHIFPLYREETTERFYRLLKIITRMNDIEEELNESIGLVLPATAIRIIAEYLYRTDRRYRHDTDFEQI